MDNLVKKLDDDATHNFIIAKASHSGIVEFRKQLKKKQYRLPKKKPYILQNR